MEMALFKLYCATTTVFGRVKPTPLNACPMKYEVNFIGVSGGKRAQRNAA